jgi:AraC family transcriptional regulator, arabinose operon regulatory protein
MGFKRIMARADFMKAPDMPLPFHLRSTGHYLLDSDYHCGSFGNEGFVEVFWGIGGEGELSIAGETLPLKPGDVVWKLTGEPHGYRTLGAPWELRWLTFDGPQADAFIKGYGYPRRIGGVGPCPIELFLEIETGLRKMNRYVRRRLLVVVAEILALAGKGLGDDGEASRIVERFVELANERYMREDVNINSLSEELGIHRSTLTKYFKAVMLMAPGEYLGKLRMQEALSYLTESDLSISEIAAKVGMPDPSHFSNAVKRVAGVSPSDLRKSKMNRIAKA